jgi:hypothetical protein
MAKPHGRRFFVCLSNDAYRASLEVRKIYVALDDREAEEQGLLRIVDESGEDYLYPVSQFAEIELPRSLARAVAASA